MKIDEEIRNSRIVVTSVRFVRNAKREDLIKCQLKVVVLSRRHFDEAAPNAAAAFVSLHHNVELTQYLGIVDGNEKHACCVTAPNKQEVNHS